MRILVTLFLIVMAFSCSKKEQKVSNIDGLWIVKKVKVGNKEITPISRWMKFNKDSTQTSGNGWLQHSVGTWSFKSNQLLIKNTNGLEDNAAPFQVKLENSTMTWSREEEGENVNVFLERIDKIPTSEGNKLMGLWKLKKVNLNNHSEEINSTKTLYISWDNRYILQSETDKKEYGIYKIHGHKPELQMVNYGDNPEFKFYNFSISNNELTLIKSDTKEKLIYSRIHQFPQ